MGVAGGPKIITSNLAVALDVNDKNSYGGTGTTWSDLSGNNRNFTLTNSPTYTTESVLSFRFTGSYVTRNINGDTPMYIENFIYKDHTYEVWFNLSTLTPTLNDATEVVQSLLAWPGYHSGIFITRDSSTGSVILTTNHLWNSTRTAAFLVGTTLTGSYSNLIPTSSWVCIHDIINYTTTQSLTYVNGVLLNNINQVPTSSMTSAQGIPTYTINIAAGGAQNPNYKWYTNNGKISSVKLYNKALSSDEVQQNYNAQKSRFGLT